MSIAVGMTNGSRKVESNIRLDLGVPENLLKTCGSPGGKTSTEDHDTAVTKSFSVMAGSDAS